MGQSSNKKWWLYPEARFSAGKEMAPNLQRCQKNIYIFKITLQHFISFKDIKVNHIHKRRYKSCLRNIYHLTGNSVFKSNGLDADGNLLLSVIDGPLKGENRFTPIHIVSYLINSNC